MQPKVTGLVSLVTRCPQSIKKTWLWSECRSQEAVIRPGNGWPTAERLNNPQPPLTVMHWSDGLRNNWQHLQGRVTRIGQGTEWRCLHKHFLQRQQAMAISICHSLKWHDQKADSFVECLCSERLLPSTRPINDRFMKWHSVQRVKNCTVSSLFAPVKTERRGCYIYCKKKPRSCLWRGASIPVEGWCFKLQGARLPRKYMLSSMFTTGLRNADLGLADTSNEYNI